MFRPIRESPSDSVYLGHALMPSLADQGRSLSAFERVFIGAAIDCRGSFSSRAGGFAPPTRRLFATAIASVIATTATAKAGHFRATVVASRCALRRPMRRPDIQCECHHVHYQLTKTHIAPAAACATRNFWPVTGRSTPRSDTLMATPSPSAS
jgi:hypothetical protein